MSDGENDSGLSLADFLAYYGGLPAEAQSIKTFTILFGDADPCLACALASESESNHAMWLVEAGVCARRG